mgnify:CR=1 FL=1
MLHRWDLLTFLHWSFEPDEIQRLLPPGLAVDTFDGRAWVGLVPFLMEVRAARGPALPWISHFCETNVRTYVHLDGENPGVWFFSLDAASRQCVLGARLTYHLPYHFAEMQIKAIVHQLVQRSRTRSIDLFAQLTVRPGLSVRLAEKGRVGAISIGPYLTRERGDVRDFHARHALAGVRVSIHDMGATPAVVSLRLDQAAQELQP